MNICKYPSPSSNIAEKTIKALSEESQLLRDALSEKEEEVRGLLTLNEQLLLRAEKALEKRFLHYPHMLIIVVIIIIIVIITVIIIVIILIYSMIVFT
jgi:hypothetical protein